MQRREGEPARKYLAKGIDQRPSGRIQLGCSLDLWNGLVQHLQEKKVDLELARELGLILPRKREGWYDVFREESCFPSATSIDGRSDLGKDPERRTAKYLNSPESIIYHKGEVLYGFTKPSNRSPKRRASSSLKGILIF